MKKLVINYLKKGVKKFIITKRWFKLTINHNCLIKKILEEGYGIYEKFKKRDLLKMNNTKLMKNRSLFLLTENDVNSKTIKKIKIAKDSVVVPLTFKTIELLKEHKIKFDLFDELLSPKDYEIIDNQVYQIGRTWDEHDFLKQIFEFRGVNIAKTIETELTSSLLKFGHRICILEKIFSEIKPNIVYVSETTKSISKIPSLFSKKYQFEIKNLFSKSNETNFRY